MQCSVLGLGIFKISQGVSQKKYNVDAFEQAARLKPETMGTQAVVMEDASQEATLSAALVSIFRGKFCDVLLPGRNKVPFNRGAVLYEAGNKDRNVFFIQSGFVKVGTILENGREIIYDIRKEGDVAGELCAGQVPRRDRAVALEKSVVIPVPFSDIVRTLQNHPTVLSNLLETFCDCLANAYQTINMLAEHEILHRLADALTDLASKVGRRVNDLIEIPVYLTQEELSQIVAARRERVSTAMSYLRRQGALSYSNQGHLLISMHALQDFKG